MYSLGMSNISSNFFLSDLSKALRNGFFHSASSNASAILNDGIVLPISYEATNRTTDATLSILRINSKGYHKYHTASTEGV